MVAGLLVMLEELERLMLMMPLMNLYCGVDACGGIMMDGCGEGPSKGSGKKERLRLNASVSDRGGRLFRTRLGWLAENKLGELANYVD